jgi:hypothetical protein
MVARHCSQIAARENTQGRHYQPFSAPLQIPRTQYQYLPRSENPKIAKTIHESANLG